MTHFDISRKDVLAPGRGMLRAGRAPARAARGGSLTLARFKSRAINWATTATSGREVGRCDLGKQEGSGRHEQGLDLATVVNCADVA